MRARSNKSRHSSNASWPSSGNASTAISRRSSQSVEVPSPSSRTSPRLGTSSSLRPNYYYSGLDLLNGSRRTSDESTVVVEGSHSGSSLTLMNGSEELPATGLTRASEKRNAEFHELFPMLAPEQFLLEDFGCALQREITIQGRIYVTERNICFYSSIFGWITDFTISISAITSLEKKSTAYFIPNAIQITTRHEKVTLSSFLARDAAYDLIYKLWCLRTHPEDHARWSMENSPEAKHRSVSIESQPKGSSARASRVTSPTSPTFPQPKVTECVCVKEGRHYSEPVVDIVLAGTPEKILGLMLEKGFMMDFLSKDQKLLDIKMTDWAPITPHTPLLSRELSYIKPLHLWVGPKQTRCDQHEVMTHLDFNDYVSTVATTNTPDVPSGHLFSVKTRTCIMWASATSSRVVVTTQVEWTGRSLVKGLIESSAIDGVKKYLVDLVKAVRRHIDEHKSQFLPEGPDGISTEGLVEIPHTPNPAFLAVQTPDSDDPSPSFAARKSHTVARGAPWRRSDLQMALDILVEAARLVRGAVDAALERLYEAYPNGINSSALLWVAIMLLGAVNLWLLFRVSTSLKRIDEKLGKILDQLDTG